MGKNTLQIPIEVSARHVHLTTEDWFALFGQEEIQIDREISQHPQFSAKQRVTLRGSKGELPEVAIVGPFRSYTQAEVAMTDARRLGITPPLSDSGHLEAAASVTIIGTAGEITRPAAILQQRHLHMSPTEAAAANFVDRQTVSVVISGPRGARLDNVLVRIHESYSLRLHLDTDEANACGITPDMTAEIIS